MEKCIEWTGAVNEKGYGKVMYQGKTQRAHRVAWIKANGHIPKGLLVCHSCDNPKCVNINHLWLGTPLDNARDRDIKGHLKVTGAAKGERHPSAKLTEKQAKAIKNDTRVNTVIAAEYGISRQTVGHIKGGRKWKHL